jgi:SMC interacting uncharacterized protein involved in chromosome segregation
MSKKTDPEAREQELLAAIKGLKDENAILLSRLDSYEKDGVDKLFNALQRKANEMADLLNKYKLTDIDIDDRNSKAFERIKVVWTDAKTISESIQALKMATAKPEEQVQEKKIEKRALTAEGIAQLVGNQAGQK